MSNSGQEKFMVPTDSFDVGLSAVDQPPENNIEVIVEDDTPEKDKGRPRRKEGQQPYDISDDEIAKYDEGVKGRIQKLRFEYHEERRLKEEAGRREMAAVEYARKLVEKIQGLPPRCNRVRKLSSKLLRQRLRLP